MRALVLALALLAGCERQECIKKGGTWTRYNCRIVQETRWYGGDCGFSVIYCNGAVPIVEDVEYCNHKCVMPK